MTADILRSHSICKDVQVEPGLLPVTGEHLTAGTVTGEARLDVSARNFWSPLAKAFVDIRVFHPMAPSNASKSIPAMYISHEIEKKRKYNSRVLNVEKAAFTPLVFCTTGGMGKEAVLFYKKAAEKISNSPNQSYSDVISYIRKRLRFELLKTCLISIRGYRGVSKKLESEDLSNIDYNLIRE